MPADAELCSADRAAVGIAYGKAEAAAVRVDMAAAVFAAVVERAAERLKKHRPVFFPQLSQNTIQSSRGVPQNLQFFAICSISLVVKIYIFIIEILIVFVNDYFAIVRIVIVRAICANK